MRLRQLVQSGSGEAAQEIADFATYLLSVGDGEESNVCSDSPIDIPSALRAGAMSLPLEEDSRGQEVLSDAAKDAFIREIYPDLSTHLAAADHPSLMQRAILTPLNANVDEMNERILKSLRLPAAAIREYRSLDTVVETDHADLYPPEFLNSLQVSGLPPHMVKLAVGLPIMLLRNMDPLNGHVNGARYIVTGLSERIIEAVAATGPRAGVSRIFIPRMKLQASDTKLPFTLQRTMFPVRLCFAMSINKSQGQSLDCVGVYLPRPCFSHGQLYVAYSRTKDPRGLKVLAPGTSTRNVVFPQVKQETQRACRMPQSSLVRVGDSYVSGEDVHDHNHDGAAALARAFADVAITVRTASAAQASDASAVDDSPSLSRAQRDCEDVRRRERRGRRAVLRSLPSQGRPLDPDDWKYDDSAPRRDSSYVFEDNDEWLSSDVIAHACALHRAAPEAAGIGGLNDPLVMCNNQQDQMMQLGPQIVNVGENHWVVVRGMIGLAMVEVFDSLNNQRIHRDLSALCNRMYAADGVMAEPPVRLQLQPIKQQVGGDDCGLFALAIQDALMRGLDVTQLEFDQAAMRKHLADCFRSKIMRGFPTIRQQC